MTDFTEDESFKLQWHKGEPPHPWRKDWFLARLKDGGRAVLTALPEEYSHDYKTADETYYTKDWVKAWMQLPDGSYIEYDPTRAFKARVEKLETALRGMVKAVCGETGFANAVRKVTFTAFPWPALDLAEEAAVRALEDSTVMLATALQATYERGKAEAKEHVEYLQRALQEIRDNQFHANDDPSVSDTQDFANRVLRSQP
jgi:hypothetical protein